MLILLFNDLAKVNRPPRSISQSTASEYVYPEDREIVTRVGAGMSSLVSDLPLMGEHITRLQSIRPRYRPLDSDALRAC